MARQVTRKAGAFTVKTYKMMGNLRGLGVWAQSLGEFVSCA